MSLLFKPLTGREIPDGRNYAVAGVLAGELVGARVGRRQLRPLDRPGVQLVVDNANPRAEEAKKTFIVTCWATPLPYCSRI